MNGIVLTQRVEDLFTEGRWRKQSIAEILALNTHIKRHPSVGSCGEAPRSVEQENSLYVGHVCFIDTAFHRLNFGSRFSGDRLGSASTTQVNFDGLWVVIAVWLRVLDVDVSKSLVGRAACGWGRLGNCPL